MINNKIKSVLISCGIISILAFKIGDEVELTQFLNARTRPSFIKSTKVAKTLSSGTTGAISDIKKFYSGNFGIKMKLTSGPFIGQTYWVYYNKKSPGMIISNEKNVQVPLDQVDENLVENNQEISAVLTENKNGLPDPSEALVPDSIDLILNSKNIINEILAEQKPPCKIPTPPDNAPQVKTVSQNLSAETSVPVEFTSTEEIVNQRPKTPFDNPRCMTIEKNDFHTCYANGKLEEISLSNNGPNAINPKNEYYISREFKINLNDRSLSDSSLMITDNPNERTSASTYSILMFFPRKQLPTVTSDGKNITMTLSNGEIVIFNAKSKEIVGGAMTEAPMEVNDKNRAVPAKINYTGEGVLIRADRNNGLPIGDDEDSKGREIHNRTIAIISKKGFKNCKIPSAQLWYNDKNLNRTLIKPEYSTDEGLDTLLKSRCGFTIK